MANTPRGKMPVSERAKQFSPFAAVKGLDLALANKERELAKKPKIEPSDDMSEDLNALLSEVTVGSTIKVQFYKNGEIVTESGEVTKLDTITHRLTVNDVIIHYSDILEISL